MGIEPGICRICCQCGRWGWPGKNECIGRPCQKTYPHGTEDCEYIDCRHLPCEECKSGVLNP